jgi:hypothetical protein
VRFHKLIFSLTLVLAASPTAAALYSFVNDQGQYVVSRTPPEDPSTEYAVLTDDGEFVRLVHSPTKRIPITHWRPWFIPKEPDPFDADPDVIHEPEPVVTVEEEASSPESGGER